VGKEKKDRHIGSSGNKLPTKIGERKNDPVKWKQEGKIKVSLVVGINRVFSKMVFNRLGELRIHLSGKIESVKPRDIKKTSARRKNFNFR